jgi:RNase P protein component
MEYIDRLAEEAVKDAIKSLVAKGQRAYSGTVPMEAVRILMKSGPGRVSQTVATAKVKDAVERLRTRKEIKAPPARQHDWVLIGHQAPSSAEASQSTQSSGERREK